MLTVDQQTNQNSGGFTPISEGPQFSMPDQGGWKKDTRGWLNKYGSSVILPIIALLVLAGGIYLYARQKTESTTLLPLEEESATVQQEEPSALEEIAAEKIVQEDNIPSIIEETATIEEIIPQEDIGSGVIVKKAEKGEGITHLARKAVKEHLTNNRQNLSNEHKVYIEDYLKDKIGSRPLEIGEEIEFSEDLINEAINASKNLTPEQLKILEEYSTLVSW